MLTGVLIVGGIIAAVILLGIWLSDGNTSSEPTPMPGYFSSPPEHGEQQPDAETNPDCPECHSGFLIETVGPWKEQFGQGTTVYENVRQRFCTHCNYSERLD